MGEILQLVRSTKADDLSGIPHIGPLINLVCRQGFAVSAEIPELLSAVTDEDPAVRHNSIWALTTYSRNIGPEADVAIPVFERILMDTNE